uniref:RNA-dependent RNA polymerase n=1 Tax=Pink bollworm virus 2 TaxID=2713147 RepID=A0A6G6C931_9VIRU|nr:RNA-dependent RNA polymerase [Pink bollworm virus 2]
MFSKLTQYQGKRDREKEMIIRREQNKQLIEPRDQLEMCITENRKIVNKAISDRSKLSIDDSFNIYLNARMNRHDVWVDYLKVCKSKSYYKFSDIKVADFHRDFSNMFPVKDIPPELGKLSPDILIYDNELKVIFLGDVACTNAYRDADRRKYLKYKEISTFYSSQGYRVKHANFIIENTLNNVTAMIREFENIGVIMPVSGVKTRSMHYHRMAASTMDDSIEYCVDPKEITNLISLNDKMEEETYDKIQLPTNILWPDIKLEEPTKTEDEIAKEIRDQVEKMDKDYFDKDINPSIKALNELKKNNENREHMEPKSTLKVCSNQLDMELHTDHRLLESYLSDILIADDTTLSGYLQWLLPSSNQINIMKKCKTNGVPSKEDGVYGAYQYKIPKMHNDNYLINETIGHLQLGKKFKNKKESPKTISPDRFLEIFSSVESMIEHYGEISNKPSFLDNTWDASTNFESDNSEDMRRIYNIIRNSNGAQLCHSMSNLYQRLTHLKTSLSTKDNIYIPPNGSFIAIIPKEHAPITSSNCDVPIIFITRIRNDSKNLSTLRGINEYEYELKTDEYTYLVSKLCRLNLNKMANWDQAGHKLVATATYISSLNKSVDFQRVTGILTLMILDVHQKTSELLDLLKYVAFMPFSDITRLSSLIKDKFDIMFKTKLDVWTLETMINLIQELSDISKLNASKPKLQLHNGIAIHESFGMTLHLPSIFDLKKRHSTPGEYIEEVAMIYTVRGKQLYGSQFMDKSIYQTAKWEEQYQDEIVKYKDWVITGSGEGKYPFDSSFGFCKDAILHAKRHFDQNITVNKNKVMRDLTSGTYNDYMHYNCSLRGCVKEKEDRLKPNDLHTTSMEACLNEYEKEKYDDTNCTSNSFCYKFLSSGKKMEFSMSEKEQRGGGRPIATPTVLTKAALMTLEKPEVSIGKQSPNNIIVPGKHKLQELCECYKKFLTHASLENYKYIYQITEDQTKFSEMDNSRKFIPYIQNNTILDENIRKVQIKVVESLNNREHLVKRMPDTIKTGPLSKHINDQGNGIKTTIGWPQGMCNFISTSIHMIADYWITHMYNKAYPENRVKTAGLVHSDDSWVAVACNTFEDFERFCKFRIIAKKLFCLKMNEKKLWGSKYLGELVSNYNINGNVHLCISKTIANAFNNLNYQNWVMDVHSQVSTLQQSYRQGANLPTLILLSTILRQQIFSSYNIRGIQRENLHLLPIELGGYPANSVFELATTGVNCHYNYILNYIKRNPHSLIADVVLRCLTLSIMKMKSIEEEDFNKEVRKMARTRISKELIVDNESDESGFRYDYTNVKLPYRGDAFSCVNHLMPQSKKVKKTIQRLTSLPFVNDGMELLVTKPKDLSVSLGHLKEQTSTIMYALAAEKYTQSARRLAVSQMLQASGKTVRLHGLVPMSHNEMLEVLIHLDNIPRATIDQLSAAFTDSNPMPDIAEAIVFNSEHEHGTVDKRKIINRLPEIDDNFKTMTPIKDVLLYIIEETLNNGAYSDYGTKKSPIQLVREESKLIKRRFASYFVSYNVKIACNLIMRLSLECKKTKLWMQPYLNQETIVSFMEDLYGKTVSGNENYRVKSVTGYGREKNNDSDVIKSIYTTCVLDSLYPDKFKVQSISDVLIEDAINNIDYNKLNLDDLLKYAIIRYYINGDKMMLMEYDKSRLFSKKYIKPQKYENGKYYGDFICDIKYGSTVARIDGEPGNVNITVNKLNMNELLMAMMLFINDSFPTERYNHPSLWYNCSIWGNKFKIGSLFLTSFTQSSSGFTQTSNSSSIPILKNETLKFDELYIDRSECDFVIEDHLRTVYKVTQDKKIRIGNVRQNLSCPLAKTIWCYGKDIDGLDNNELLHSKIILNLTMRKPFSNTKKDMEKLLRDSDTINDSILVAMYRNLLSKFSNSISPIDLFNLPSLEIIDDVMITGLDVSKYVTEHNMTDADDLTHVESHFIYEEVEESGAMVKYNNLIKYIAQCYMINLTEIERDSILSNIITDNTILTKIKSDLMEEGTNELLDEMILVESKEANIMTICFILANDLESSNGFDNVDLQNLLRNKLSMNKNSEIICSMIKSDLDKIIFLNEYEANKKELLDMLINK